LTTSKRTGSESKIRITGTKLLSGRYGDEVRVFFTVGGRKSSVDLHSEDLTEASLKGAIAEKLAALFSQERAQSFVGRSYSVEEIVKDGVRFNESRRSRWLDW
jgi:hypothetical protein